jgi:D-alanyl-D-alanine carboxypeptidase
VSRWIRVVGGTALGAILGASLTLAAQSSAGPDEDEHQRPNTSVGPMVQVGRAEAPETFLAWVPRGLPRGFAAAVRDLPQVGSVTVVSEDDVWLRGSWNAAGEVADDPPAGYRIPLDAAAIDPRTFARFLPPPDRATLAAVANGDGILGATSAALRGLGPGAVLDLGPGRKIRIAAVLPDELVGAAELVVSKDTGDRIGIRRDRYLLLQPAAGTTLSVGSLLPLLRPLLPADLGVNRRIQVRAPGQTPYFRAGDAVLPPVVVKMLFGEFAARPGSRPGTLEVDPAWTRAHIVTTRVPVLGSVTCNRGIVDQLRGAMQEVVETGLQDAIETFHGCFVPRFIGWDSHNMISYHSWGIAFDVNLADNLRGAPPHQDPRLVQTLADWGFVWGGTWLVPDGNHFEYHRSV